MQSFSDPLNRLHEDGGWFARAHDVRLMTVRCSGDLRSAVVELLPRFEFHADNFSSWVVFEDAHTRTDPGWSVRATRLLTDWDARRAAFAKDGVQMPATEPVPDHPADLRRFRAAAVAVTKALRAPLRGVVLVLAPTVIEDPAAFETDVTALLGDVSFRAFRFVLVVDEDLPRPATLHQALGERAMECDCTIDRAQQDRDFDALLSSGGGDPKSFGMAAPRGVVPPPRVDDPPPAPKEAKEAALRKAGIDPAYLESAPKLRDLVLGAAVAMKKGDGPRAIDQQREARDMCAALGLHDAEVITQVTLASYLSGLGQRRLAISELEDASAKADEHQLPRAQSQALLALGLLHALDRNLPLAARAYGEAARVAEQAELPSLAIEAWRLAGQLALEAGQSSQAITCFGRAIRLAEGTPPEEVQGSSASEAARALAKISHERGLVAQAASLYAQADRFEAGQTEPPEPPTPSKPARAPALVKS